MEENHGEEAPYLSLQDARGVKIKGVDDQTAGVDQGNKVDDHVADRDVQHEILDAFVPVPEKERGKTLPNRFQF